MSQALYADPLISITENSILFRQYYFPFGSKKIELSAIAHVEVVKPTFFSGKWRIHGTGDFRTWFTRDPKRAGRDCIFIVHLHKKWRRIGFTAEDSGAVRDVFEDRNIPVRDNQSNRRSTPDTR